ncbi:MAG TPA: hypothetical protein VLB27_07630, partial [candidate division Zixibacteria bacterium]|nr:hypothetical protein [candidate division Zixibacteria bacterium]
PPYDPLFYGLLISATDKSAFSSVSEYDFSPERTEVFALDRIRNDRFESQGFTLKEPTQLHIYALGEFAFNEFADYAYIEDVETMEMVWEMTEDNTTHAGGATKNRMFDDVITLPAGSYMAHYSSDGSHSYNDWNSAKPFDPTKWGITVYGVGKSFDKSKIDLFSDMPTGSELLVDLTQVCDDEFLTKSLTIDKPTAVRIFALGEGSSGRMYDYGWIEEAKTGKVVWKMRYRTTRHAGGASKNRMANVVVELEPGEYDVVFVTDGSHSFCHFNASKPSYPQKWGITVSKK